MRFLRVVSRLTMKWQKTSLSPQEATDEETAEDDEALPVPTGLLMAIEAMRANKRRETSL